MKKLLFLILLATNLMAKDWYLAQYYTPMGTAVKDEKIATKEQENQNTRLSIFKDVYMFYFPRDYEIDGDKVLKIKIIGLTDLTALTLEGRALNGKAGKCFTIVTQDTMLKELIKRNKEILFQLVANTSITQVYKVEGLEKVESKMSSLDWSKIDALKDKETAAAILNN